MTKKKKMIPYSNEPITGAIADICVYGSGIVFNEGRIKVYNILRDMDCYVYGHLLLDDYDTLVSRDDTCYDDDEKLCSFDDVAGIRFFVDPYYNVIHNPEADDSVSRKEFEDELRERLGKELPDWATLAIRWLDAKTH
jgi:hypothetical protein